MPIDLNWLRTSFEALIYVESVEIVGESMSIARVDHPTVQIGFAKEPVLHRDEVERAYGSNSAVRFVVNIPKGAKIAGDALAFAQERGIALGSVADSFRALRDHADPADYEPAEIAFVLRGILQHSAVSAVERLDDFRFLIERHLFPPVTVLICPEYQPTADTVRQLLGKYDSFDILVATNPNSDPTVEAFSAAREAGIVLMKWRNFLGRLAH